MSEIELKNGSLDHFLEVMSSITGLEKEDVFNSIYRNSEVHWPAKYCAEVWREALKLTDARTTDARDTWVRIEPGEIAPSNLPHGDYPIRRASEPLMTVTGFYDGRWWDVTNPERNITDDVIAYYRVPDYEG